MKLLRTQSLGLTLLFLMISLSCSHKTMVTKNSITFEQYRDMFSRLEVQGVDFTKPLLYGYFFFDSKRNGLLHLSNDLVNDGYGLVSLDLIEGDRFRLHIEKIETHSPESLYQRGVELTAIASKYSVEVYDGFDVGNSDPSKALVSDESFLVFFISKY